ncbi:MAG: polymerase sigma-E factor [Planctomycetota bacterium]|jgi:RNA polymerase sigma-70 factor (ECF subfamily)
MTTPVDGSDGDAALDEAIRRVQAGDADAYGLVVRRCAPRLRSWVARRAPSGIDADEVAHQTFITAFAQIDRHRSGTPVHAWLVGIARNLLLNECRAARRRQAHLRAYADVAWLEAAERRLADGEEDASEPDRWVAAMRACMNELGDGARALVNLRYAEELPLETIAARQGRTAGAIAKSLCLIRRRLHACVSSRVAASVGGL